MCLARKNPFGKTQSYCEHAKNVAIISTAISHYPNISKLLAHLHDVGKLSDEFQNYIKNGGERGSIIHAWQGAFLANELFATDGPDALLLKEVIGFCVTAHHNHLDDGMTPDGSDNYFEKFSKTADGKYHYDQIKSKLSDADRAALQILFDKAKVEIHTILATIGKTYKNKNSSYFAVGLFVKYLYSCLVDADRLDAYLFDVDERFENSATNWDSLIKIFEEQILKFPNATQIDKIRKSISEKCKSAAEKKAGIYQLSVPTGGGKTLSSLRFALHHCQKYRKKRIVYVIPYLSIIEQTASNLRDILTLPEDNDIIFEHHSSIVEPEDEKASEMRKLSTARWDSPIIITTMVQFLESVMSAKGGELRKFAAMADSVIIFDEIQSMPLKAIHCFNEVVSFLAKILNSTIILCSATQPALEQTQRTNLLLSDSPKLIDCVDDFKDIKRVKVMVEGEKDCSNAADFILEKATKNDNCLVIVNTRKSAFEIYNNLKSKATGFEVLHLSTAMCPIHRMQIINNVRRYLNDGTKIICVSTQLIEAGVDISFSCVVRAMAGLDSIAQAAGRCNRNGESASPKAVYTFPLKCEQLNKLQDIKSGKETTVEIISGKTAEYDLLDETIMNEFYRRYFANKDAQMDYPTSHGATIYAMLSLNTPGRDNYKNRTGNQFEHCLAQAFDLADRNFKVIEDNTKSVVVLYGEAESLLDEYRKQPMGIFTKDKVQIIKKLQKFSVSLYEWQLKELYKQHALTILDEETNIMFLNKNYYSQESGVRLQIIEENLIV